MLEVRSFPDIDRFKTDIREVFGFIQRSGSPDEEREFIFQNKGTFEELDEDAFDVIAALTGGKELETVKEDYREKGGKINMCEAILGMIEEGRVEGRAEGETKGEAKIVAMIKRKLDKKKSLPAISDELELDLTYVREVTALINSNPEWTDLQIAEALIRQQNN